MRSRAPSLAWLLGGPRGGEGQRFALTRLECLRAVARPEATQPATPTEAERLLGVFTGASAEWTMIDIAAELVERAGAPFPEEPVRALDAIHLASVLVVRAATPDVEMAALDARVRRNAARLGIAVRPE